MQFYITVKFRRTFAIRSIFDLHTSNSNVFRVFYVSALIFNCFFQKKKRIEEFNKNLHIF